MRSKFTLWLSAGLVVAAVAGLAVDAVAQAPLKIGVLNDQGSIFADVSGRGSVAAAEMAVEDFGGKVLGRSIEVVSADTQNKPDIGAGIARRWFDAEGVVAIFDPSPSSVALAVQELAKERGKITVMSSAGTSLLTGKNCSPTGFQWTYDTVALANGTAAGIVREGGDSWFFITSDFAFGHSLEADAKAVVAANNGKVLGQARHPLNLADFSSFILQAQGSRAKVIGLANSGVDAVNAVKQIAEFKALQQGQKLAALTMFITDIHGIGLEIAQGLYLTESFYWGLDDATKAWSKRFAARFQGRMPTSAQAGVYSAVAHYLKAVAAAGTDAGPAVAEKMRATIVQDFTTPGAKIRKDGRLMRDFYLFQVKRPSESTGAWDYYNVIRKIPAADAAPPESGRGCSLTD
ncbi:ABC transporter substrate-binding protein [Ferrovibrio sp.]|uniref:ABC transporter substrate-binding protein n=1 Tax=Ferrovibrio sp. TaxID=1917215 RepID=UPI003D0ABC82